MNLNRKCFFCGTRYHYCPSCPDDELKPVWHVLFCKETCKQMDKILSDHTFKRSRMPKPMRLCLLLPMILIKLTTRIMSGTSRRFLRRIRRKNTSEDSGRDCVREAIVDENFLGHIYYHTIWRICPFFYYGAKWKIKSNQN